MIRRFLPALLALLLLATPSPAQSIKLPATLVVPGPGLVVVVPDSVDADDVAWISLDDGLQLIPTSLLKDSKTACGVALTAKTYRVRAIATKSKDGKAVFSPWSECVVTVGTPGPQPPGPGPGPGPQPNPPDAALLKLLTDAVAKDADPDRFDSVAKLAAVYRNAAKVTATDSAYKTVKDIDGAVRFASQGSIGVLAVPNLRDAIGVWLRSQLPTKEDAPLDDALRQKYVAAWTALAAALEKVK